MVYPMSLKKKSWFIQCLWKKIMVYQWRKSCFMSVFEKKNHGSPVSLKKKIMVYRCPWKKIMVYQCPWKKNHGLPVSVQVGKINSKKKPPFLLLLIFIQRRRPDVITHFSGRVCWCWKKTKANWPSVRARARVCVCISQNTIYICESFIYMIVERLWLFKTFISQWGPFLFV